MSLIYTKEYYIISLNVEKKVVIDRIYGYHD